MIKLLYHLAVKGAWLILHLLYRVEVYGRENIREHTNYIVAANHNHWADPVAVAASYRHIIRYMAKKETFSNPVFAKVLTWIGVFPVDREANDRAAIKKSLEILRSGEHLGIFPEGTRNKTYRPMPVKAGTALLAYKTGVEILPVTIVASYRIFSKMRIIFSAPVKIEATDGEKLSPDALTERSTDIVNHIYEVYEIYHERS